MKTFKQFTQQRKVAEEVAVNAAGAGNVAGIGIGAQGEPGGTKAIMNKMMRRRKRNVDSKVSS